MRLRSAALSHGHLTWLHSQVFEAAHLEFILGRLQLGSSTGVRCGELGYEVNQTRSTCAITGS
jgi:hypothetical protein